MLVFTAARLRLYVLWKGRIQCAGKGTLLFTIRDFLRVTKRNSVEHILLFHYLNVCKNLQSRLQILLVPSNVRKLVRNSSAFPSDECSVRLTPRLDSHFERSCVANLHGDP